MAPDRRGAADNPASHFYEWRTAGRVRQPQLIRHAAGDFLALAGLLGRWTNPDSGEIQEAVTILTTSPSQIMAPIHNRMPVLLDDFRTWLAESTPIGDLLELLRPCPDAWLDIYPVSGLVNRVSNEGPELALPLAVDASVQLRLDEADRC